MSDAFHSNLQSPASQSSRSRNLSSGNFYTFADVKHAWKTDKQFDYPFWVEITLILFFSNIKLYVGPVLVVAAFATIFSISYFGFFHVLPYVFTQWTIWCVINYCFGLLCMVSILYHYIMAINTPPGYLPDESSYNESGECSISPSSIPSNKNSSLFCSISSLASKTTTLLSILSVKYSNSNRFCSEGNFPIDSNTSNILKRFDTNCKKCNISKPLRAHHCSTCNRCVLKMDHHCPWVNNCVGLNNYSHFISFLFWVFLTTLYICMLLTPWAFSRYQVFFVDNHFSHSTVESTLETRPKTSLLRGMNGDADKLFGLNYISNIFSSNDHEKINNQFDMSLDAQNSIVKSNVSNQFNSISNSILERDTLRLKGLSENENSKNSIEQEDPSDDTFVPITMGDVYLLGTFAGSAGVCIGVGGLFLFHLHLLRLGQTTLEYYDSFIKPLSDKPGSTRSPTTYVNRNRSFDLGFTRNLNLVFGNIPWFIGILPFVITPPKCAVSGSEIVISRLLQILNSAENLDV